jgi:hypothetical protein
VSATRSASRQARASAADGRTPSRPGVVDRNELLRALFPSGIPATEEAIRGVNAWLDEAERLAQLR